MMSDVIVYSRRGCHLCEVMLEELDPLCRGRANIVVRDVDSKPEWASLYSDSVPVLCYGDTEICRFEIDRKAIRALFDHY
jgi:thioredoxin reductase (NADPH)